MARQPATRVVQWAGDSARSLDRSDRMYVSVHLDDLLGAEYVKSSAIDYIRMCVETLFSVDVSRRYSFRVAIALREIEGLATEAPNIEAISEELHDLEPPSLYICRDILLMYVPYFEEYRRPLEYWWSEMPEGVVVYYTCFRSLEAARLSEAYSRLVWLDIMTSSSARLYREMVGT